MILGACREHTLPGSLEFCDLDDATTFFEHLDRNEFQLASEATVVALGSLAREPQLYNPRPDYHYVIKALRSLLMRRMGINVLGFEIVPAIVKQHLRDIGLTEERIRSLLNPNDRQDVDLTYGLLKEVWSLPGRSGHLAAALCYKTEWQIYT
ncbi:hypothetical protein B0H14DRAFT_2602430 [Mycena olivaceomarginata]|nr:hypothetical protein B0H14DRAFT_2602430 [Mycena olivaceomarginata]